MEAKALLDELLTGVYKVDGNNERQFSYDDADGYISNPMTLIRLRVESLKVNFSFFKISGNCSPTQSRVPSRLREGSGSCPS